MPVDEDKYPTESGRRRFVKGVVGSAALGGVATGGAGAINTATSSPGAGGGPTQFVGIEITDGPAPRGMPIIPIEINNGEIQGVWPEVEERTAQGRTVQVAEQDVGGFTYSSTWFQYCGIQQYAGTAPDADVSNSFLVTEKKYDWTGDLEAGEPYTVDDFSDYETWSNEFSESGLGKPAIADWRATSEGRPLPVQVFRTPELPRMINGEGQYSSIPAEIREFLDAASADGFMAWLDKCTHFCCVPGYATSDYPGAPNHVYCSCHQSIYDPFSPVQYQFTALPRPD